MDGAGPPLLSLQVNPVQVQVPQPLHLPRLAVLVEVRIAYDSQRLQHPGCAQWKVELRHLARAA